MSATAVNPRARAAGRGHLEDLSLHVGVAPVRGGRYAQHALPKLVVAVGAGLSPARQRFLEVGGGCVVTHAGQTRQPIGSENSEMGNFSVMQSAGRPLMTMW